ncbi:MAG: metallophosphoesterase family protein, partial [Polyangiales bacterium]
VGLDLNPANFGWDTGGALHYLDDEVYEPSSMREIAEAAVSRIPEEPQADRKTWRHWGGRLRETLEPWVRGPADEHDLRLGAEQYPVTPAFRERRWAFVAGLVPRAAPRRRNHPRRTCVLADVHGNLPALEAVLRDAEREGADSFLFLGDAVGYGPHPLECVARLADLRRAIWIRGNHDHAIGTGALEEGMNRLARECALWTRQSIDDEARRWLADLPVEHRDSDWLAVHGAPRDPHHFLAYVYEMTFRENLENLERRELSVCFYGHTHVPFVHRKTPDGAREKLGAPPVVELAEGTILLVNPGSVGQPRNGDPRASYALWDRDTNRIAFSSVPYPVERCVRDLRRAGLAPDLAHRLEMGR